MTAAERYGKIVFKGPKTHSTAWVDPGWRLFGGEDNILPTFVSCEKRSRPPPRPAGGESRDDLTLARWAKDEYRFPPYHYKVTAGLLNAKGDQWRYPNTDER